MKKQCKHRKKKDGTTFLLHEKKKSKYTLETADDLSCIDEYGMKEFEEKVTRELQVDLWADGFGGSFL